MSQRSASLTSLSSEAPPSPAVLVNKPASLAGPSQTRSAPATRFDCQN
jgi:hypothetical protein